MSKIWTNFIIKCKRKLNICAVKGCYHKALIGIVCTSEQDAKWLCDKHFEEFQNNNY